MQPRPSEKFRELAMTVQFNNYQEEITKNPTNNYRALLGKNIIPALATAINIIQILIERNCLKSNFVLLKADSNT